MKELVIKTLISRGYIITLCQNDDMVHYVHAIKQKIEINLSFGLNVDTFWSINIFEKSDERTDRFYYAEKIMNEFIRRENKKISALDTYLDVFEKTYNFLDGIGL